jgi:hypothetical protein
MGGNWWLVAETLRAREKDIGTLYQRYWYASVDETAARRREARRAALRVALRRLFGMTRASDAAAVQSTCACGEQDLACC